MRPISLGGAKSMDPAYLNGLLKLWPLLLAGLFFAEVSAYCFSRRLSRFQLLIGAVAFVLFVVLHYATERPSLAMQTRPLAYFAVVAWVTAVPLVVLSAGAAMLAKVRTPLWRQLGLTVLSIAVIAALPLFALMSVCASGVDCV